jgi:hypothetical protein
MLLTSQETLLSAIFISVSTIGWAQTLNLRIYSQVFYLLYYHRWTTGCILFCCLMRVGVKALYLMINSNVLYQLCYAVEFRAIFSLYQLVAGLKLSILGSIAKCFTYFTTIAGQLYAFYSVA